MGAPSSPSPVSRRQALVAGTAGLISAAAVPLAGQSPDQAVRARVPADPTKIQGAGSTPVGARSPFERPVRTGRGTSSQTPLQDLTGIITPSDLHFERHHAGVPAIDPERYSLLVHGLVERPTVFTLADLKRFPGRSIIRFLECSGNGSRAYRSAAEDAEVTPQQVDGLTSTGEWTGVPFQQPGTLTPDETYGRVAYLLFLNGVIAEDTVMDQSSLPTVRMPARDRFVLDNRRGVREVK